MTSKNQEQLEYATFFKRLGAYFIDGMILSALITILASIGIFSLFGVEFDASKLQDPSYALTNNTGYMLITLLISTAYYAIFQSSKWQATVGKKLLHIKVTTLNGERIGFIRAVGRHLAMTFLSSILFIGYLMVFFTKKKQALHDMIAKTVVVKAK